MHTCVLIHIPVISMLHCSPGFFYLAALLFSNQSNNPKHAWDFLPLLICLLIANAAPVHCICLYAAFSAQPLNTAGEAQGRAGSCLGLLPVAVFHELFTWCDQPLRLSMFVEL